MRRPAGSGPQGVPPPAPARSRKKGRSASRDPEPGGKAAGRTVLLGLGNPVLSDDAVGLAVAAEVRRLLAERPIPGVDVLASTRAGFELIDLLQGYRRAVIVDCLAQPEPIPGRVRRLQLHDVAGSARLVSAHEISLDVAFRLAEQMGISMPAEVEILAVEGADLTTVSEAMTPAVQAAVGPLAQEIHQRLSRLAPDREPPDSPEFQRRRAFYAPPEA